MGARGDRVPSEFGSGDANAKCPFRFCHVSKFQAPDCLHYKHYNAAKGLPTLDSDREFTASQQYTFDVYQISTSRAEIQHFFWQGHGQKYRSKCNRIRHFKWIFFWGGGLAPPQTLPLVGRGTPSQTSSLAFTPHQAFRIRICVPQNSSQIFATGTRPYGVQNHRFGS